MNETISRAEKSEYSTLNIRALEVRFDSVVSQGDHFIFFINQVEIAQVLKKSLNRKTILKLTSMSE